jgi:hypothetical protein
VAAHPVTGHPTTALPCRVLGDPEAYDRFPAGRPGEVIDCVGDGAGGQLALVRWDDTPRPTLAAWSALHLAPAAVATTAPLPSGTPARSVPLCSPETVSSSGEP